jgi:hypothetical protein
MYFQLIFDNSYPNIFNKSENLRPDQAGVLRYLVWFSMGRKGDRSREAGVKGNRIE